MKTALGAVVLFVLVGGCGFIRYGLPFLQDDSFTLDCDSPQVEGACDEWGTLGNFWAQICGRAAFTLHGEAAQLLNIGDAHEPVERGDVTLSYRCDGVEVLELKGAALLFERGEWEDWKRLAAAQRDREVLNIYERWLDGDIDTAIARQHVSTLTPWPRR